MKTTVIFIWLIIGHFHWNFYDHPDMEAMMTILNCRTHNNIIDKFMILFNNKSSIPERVVIGEKSLIISMAISVNDWLSSSIYVVKTFNFVQGNSR